MSLIDANRGAIKTGENRCRVKERMPGMPLRPCARRTPPAGIPARSGWGAQARACQSGSFPRRPRTTGKSGSVAQVPVS